VPKFQKEERNLKNYFNLQMNSLRRILSIKRASKEAQLQWMLVAQVMLEAGNKIRQIKDLQQKY